MNDRICAYAPCTVSLSGRRSNVTACTENHRKLANKAKKAAVAKAVLAKDSSRWCRWCGQPLAGRSDQRWCGDGCRKSASDERERDGHPARPGRNSRADVIGLLSDGFHVATKDDGFGKNGAQVGWTGHDHSTPVAPALGSDLIHDGASEMANLGARQSAFIPKHIRELPAPDLTVTDGPLSSVELDGLQVIFPSVEGAPRPALELAAETLSPKERQELRIQMKDDAERSAVKAEQTADLKAACLKWIDEDEWNAVAPNHQAAKWLAFERFHYAHNRKVRAFKKALAQSRLELAC